MPPRRPRRKAAIEATARFGAEARGNRRYQARRQNQEEEHTPSVDVVSDKAEEEPAEDNEEEEEEEEEDLEMKEDEGPSQGEEGKNAAPRENEGEASTAPVPEKVSFNLYILYESHESAALTGPATSLDVIISKPIPA